MEPTPRLVALWLAVVAAGAVGYLVVRFIAGRFVSSKWAALIAFLTVAAVSVIGGEFGLFTAGAALVCLLIDLASEPRA